MDEKQLLDHRLSLEWDVPSFWLSRTCDDHKILYIKLMTIVTNLILALLMAAWLGAIAVFSIQNIREVSLKFLMFESIQLPVGVLLSFCVGLGLVIGSLAPLLWQGSKNQRRRGSSPSEYSEYDVGF
jgi:uncharacterized integral membrane protein